MGPNDFIGPVGRKSHHSRRQCPDFVRRDTISHLECADHALLVGSRLDAPPRRMPTSGPALSLGYQNPTLASASFPFLFPTPFLDAISSMPPLASSVVGDDSPVRTRVVVLQLPYLGSPRRRLTGHIGPRRPCAPTLHERCSTNCLVGSSFHNCRRRRSLD